LRVFIAGITHVKFSFAALLIIYFPGYSGRENYSQSRQDVTIEQGVEGANENNANGKTATIAEHSWKPLIERRIRQQKRYRRRSKKKGAAVAGVETPPQNKKYKTEDHPQINTAATPAEVDVYNFYDVFFIRCAERFVGPVKRIGLLQPEGF